METLLTQIKEYYNQGLCYFESKINGQYFKIRMNKDHGRNGNRNDDQYFHNLSLVNINDPSVRILRVNKLTGKIQWQIENINDWDDAEEIITDFLYSITDL